MPRFTIQQQLISGLEGRGYHEYTAKRYSGCRAFKHPDKPTQLIFVGKGGSFRCGQNRMTAMVISSKFTEAVMTEGLARLKVSSLTKGGAR